MREKGGGVGAFRIAGGLRGGMRTQFRWSRVSWDGTGRDWEGMVCNRKAPGEAAGGQGGVSGTAGGRGFALGVWLLGKGRPDNTRCVRT